MEFSDLHWRQMQGTSVYCYILLAAGQQMVLEAYSYIRACMSVSVSMCASDFSDWTGYRGKWP